MKKYSLLSKNKFVEFLYYSQKSILILVMVVVGTMSNAIVPKRPALSGHDVEVDGIYYVLNVDEAYVSYNYSQDDKYISPYSGEIYIPATITVEEKNYNVTRIWRHAFDGCSGITSITIPNSIKTIDEFAFSNCTGMTTITIPKGVTEIGENAFWLCSSLDSIVVLCYQPFNIETNTFSGISNDAVLYVPSGSKSKYENIEGWNQFKTIEEILIDGSTFSALTEEGVEMTFRIISVKEKTCEVYGLKDYQTVGKVTIPSEVNSFRVIEIGGAAFAKCSSITSVIIPNSVETIGSLAFGDCSSLSDIILPNSLKTIGSGAFSGCKSLKSIVIPSSVTCIESSLTASAAYRVNPFRDCESLESIVVEEGNTVYDSRNNCNAIIGKRQLYTTAQQTYTIISGCKNTIIPTSVTYIEDYSFDGCGLTHIEIPSNVQYIGSNAFSDNYIEKDKFVNHSALIPENNNYWGCTILDTSTENGFYISNGRLLKYTGNDTEIVIPDIVTSIGNNVFYGHANITSVTIPSNVISIENYAFSGCSGLTRVELNSNAVVAYISSYSPTSNYSMCNIFGEQVEEYILGEDVTSIGNNAFYGCSNLKSLTISKNITTIGTNAFNGCTGDLILNCNIPHASSSSNSVFKGSKFSSLIISDGIESIGDYAFYGCSSLTSVIFSNTLTSIGREAFSGCYGVKSLTIPNSVTKINYRAFYGCSGLTSISFGKGLTSIGSQIFKGCTGLTSIFIPSCVTSIGEESFEACTGLTSVTIPNSVKTIGSSFCECTGLTSITIPEGVQSIGKDAFNNCSKLATINIANSVTDIGYRAFQGTAWYNSQPDGMVYAGKVAYTYKGTMPENTSIDFKQGTLGIGENAFSDRSELTGITIPNSMKTIGSEAFSGCSSLTSVTIPNSVTSIGSSAFYDCTNIKLYLDKNSVALFDLWKNTIRSSTPQMYCKDCIYDINTGRRISLFEKTGSSVRVDKFEPKNYTLISQSLSINGKIATIPYYVKGLNSSTSIGEMVLTIKYNDSFGDSHTFTDSENVSTEVINLTTNPAKIISIGNAIVSATTNLDDEETNVGFEWRRIDWPDDFTSNKANASLYEGEMGGYIRNIYTGALWRVRPYYLSDSGTYYYGNWEGLDPTNTSYFEPAVHTNSAVTVLETTASVKGYAMRGTDNIVSQGFKYWSLSNSARGIVSQTTAVPSNAKTVEATGNIMSAEFTDLEYETEYHFVAFVTTSENETFYGEERIFVTDERPDIRGDVNGDGVVNGTDIQAIINLIVESEYDEKADVNEDGTVNGTDIQEVINIIVNAE